MKARSWTPWLWIGAAVYLIWSFWNLPVDPERIARGAGRALEFLLAFVQPDFVSRGREIVEGIWQSVAMSLAATGVGALLSIPVGLCAARGLVPGWLREGTRGFLVVTRTFPELIIAIYCVALLGFGTFAGLVTLIIATIGFLGKLLAEEIESIPKEPLDAMDAAGASWFHKVRYAVFPAVLPRMTGLTLYRLDINLRESAVIGIVGAGGIGGTLGTAIDRYEFRSASAILIIIILLVLGIEWISNRVRQRMVGGQGEIACAPTWLGSLIPAKLARRSAWVLVPLAFLAPLAWILASVSPDYLLSAPTVALDLAQRSFPPDWQSAGKMWKPLGDTVQIATLGTAWAVVIGVPLAFLAAKNTSPHPLCRGLAIGIAVTSRSVNSLIWALILVKLIGPGILAGVVAIGLRSIGFITKLLYESVEEIARDPLDALRSTGAGRAAVFRYAVLPQVLPTATATVLYRWDINIRESAMVGLVGAGGIGLLLDGAVNSLQWHEAMMILLLIFLLVLAAESVSNRLRKRLI